MPLEAVSQCKILCSSVAVLLVMTTFFVSTCLWVYMEPILSIYLMNEFNVAEWALPLFFLIFSLGYLFASITLCLTKIGDMVAYKLSSGAFILTGLCHLLLIFSSENELGNLIQVAAGLFFVGYFSTFTLIPIYK